ncbi:MAG: hypothetical protein HRU34_14110 [Richelia sp.]|nr:hypothetical protein [Richelia sp.]
MPKIYATFGQGKAVVIPALQDYLTHESHGVFPRITSVNCLQEIGKQCENLRWQSIDVLTKQLKLFTKNPAELNGFIVPALIELQAAESGLVIYSAVAAEAVPEDIVGSWDDIQKILGVTADDLQLLEESFVEQTPTTSVVEDVAVEEESFVEHSPTESVVESVVVEEEPFVEQTRTESVVEDVAVEEESVVEQTPTTSVVEDVVVEEEPVVKDNTSTAAKMKSKSLPINHSAEKTQVKPNKFNANMIEDLLPNKSSSKKAETNSDKSFGGNRYQGKSKTTKNKKR